MKGAELIQEFEKYLYTKDKSMCTITTYRRLLVQMLKYIDKHPTEITQNDLDRYKVYLKENYDSNSLLPIVSAINHFYIMLGKSELKLTAPSKVIKNVIPLTENEIERMFAAAYPDPMDHALLVTLYYGQLRKSELLNLNKSDIDFERQKIRINHSKGGQAHEINIHPIALKAIQRYLQTRPEDDCDILFLSKEGGRLTRTPLNKRVKEYAVKAGIRKRVYPHLFRHTCISHMADNGATLPEIQRQSRHKDIKTLMVYIHPNEKKAKEAYMRTVVGGVSQEENGIETQPRPTTTSIASKQDRELLLVDALCSGRISEDTFKTAIDAIRRSGDESAQNIYIGP